MSKNPICHNGRYPSIFMVFPYTRDVTNIYARKLPDRVTLSTGFYRRVHAPHAIFGLAPDYDSRFSILICSSSKCSKWQTPWGRHGNVLYLRRIALEWTQSVPVLRLGSASIIIDCYLQSRLQWHRGVQGCPDCEGAREGSRVSEKIYSRPPISCTSS